MGARRAAALVLAASIAALACGNPCRRDVRPERDFERVVETFDSVTREAFWHPGFGYGNEAWLTYGETWDDCRRVEWKHGTGYSPEGWQGCFGLSWTQDEPAVPSGWYHSEGESRFCLPFGTRLHAFPSSPVRLRHVHSGEGDRPREIMFFVVLSDDAAGIPVTLDRWMARFRISGADSTLP